jgi:alpha-glucosidase
LQTLCQITGTSQMISVKQKNFVDFEPSLCSLDTEVLANLPNHVFWEEGKFVDPLTNYKENNTTVNNQIGELIYPDVVRFFPSDPQLRKEAEKYPSFAIDPPRPGIGVPPSLFSVKPHFLSTPESFSVIVPVEEGTSFYGAGETPGRLLLNGRRIVVWPTDNPEYDENSDRCYQAHPFVLAVTKNGNAFGVIFDTTYKVTIDLKDNIDVSSQHPFSVVIIERKTPQEVVMTLSELTGKMPMPPKWSLGYHQCRYSYYPQSTVLDVAKEFRNRNIPADVIWMDIHYMDGFRIFTTDPQTFPEPEKLNDELHEIGFKSVWMIDPGVKKEIGYSVYDQLVEGDMAVKNKDKENFVGPVWPGDCIFPDFTMEKTREWWGGLYEKFMAMGVDGVWNDMNEPAVFYPNCTDEALATTMPLDNHHRGYGEGDHSRFHNVYGMLMAKASREGIEKATPNKRPFVLTRSNYLGGQKYCATWTGDNHSQWNHLHMSIPMVLNLGISGQPYSGPDIGGFSGNADGDLFARWMGFGALLPFARGHSNLNTDSHEPWSFGPDVEKICKTAISRRYVLLPYLYTLFYMASQTGLPVAMPLFFVDPVDPKLRDEDRAFMLGENLLVVADIYAKENKGYSPVSIPTNVQWYPLKIDNETNEHLPELKIRAGTIIPAQSPIQFTDQAPEEAILFVALDENKTATGIQYHDKGDGYSYKDGEYLLTKYEASLSGDRFILKMSEEGNYEHPVHPLKIVVMVDTDTVYHLMVTQYSQEMQFKLDL